MKMELNGNELHSHIETQALPETLFKYKISISYKYQI